MSDVYTLSNKEAMGILNALRFYQERRNGQDTNELLDDEIEALCERLNMPDADAEEAMAARKMAYRMADRPSFDARRFAGILDEVSDFLLPWMIASSTLRTDDGEEVLYWSNQDGWVEQPDADRFTESERKTLNLPIGGEWERAWV